MAIITSGTYNEQGIDAHGILTDWELLEQQSTGQLLGIDMQTGLASNIGPNPGVNWTALGTGDFNNDGFPDILLQQNQTGQVAVWEMNDNTLVASAAIATPGVNWKPVTTGDINADEH